MAAKLHIHTRINGEAVDFLCEARQSLLEVLRETLGLTGTKERRHFAGTWIHKFGRPALHRQ